MGVNLPSASLIEVSFGSGYPSAADPSGNSVGAAHRNASPNSPGSSEGS